MPNFKTTILIEGQPVTTLKDILPEIGKPLDILFIAKTPALGSVEVGHYFQGRQGAAFWNKLKNYGILKIRPNTFEDENLLENNFGLTDIVKVPRNYGNEPSDDEYRAGIDRILSTTKKYSPKVIVFVYKGVLDKILQLAFDLELSSNYGFNEELEARFQSKVFVFPMPGTPCSTKQSEIALIELKKLIFQNRTNI